MPPEPPIDPLFVSTLTIVVHLPQPLPKVVELIRTASELWPNATFVGGLDRWEIPADEH